LLQNYKPKKVKKDSEIPFCILSQTFSGCFFSKKKCNVEC